MRTAIIRSGLDKAAEQLVILEHQIERKDFSSCVIKKAQADFISSIPSSRSLSGCKDSCSLFCRCDPDLYTDEKQERHELFMRYFDLRSAAKKMIGDGEQMGLMIPSSQRQQLHQPQKNKPKRKNQLVVSDEQLEIEI